MTARGIAFADMLAEHLHRLHAIAVADLFDQAKAARDMAAENSRYAVEREGILDPWSAALRSHPRHEQRDRLDRVVQRG